MKQLVILLLELPCHEIEGINEAFADAKILTPDKILEIHYALRRRDEKKCCPLNADDVRAVLEKMP